MTKVSGTSGRRGIQLPVTGLLAAVLLLSAIVSAVPAGQIIAWGSSAPDFIAPANNSGFVETTAYLALRDDGTIVSLRAGQPAPEGGNYTGIGREGFALTKNGTILTTSALPQSLRNPPKGTGYTSVSAFSDYWGIALNGTGGIEYFTDWPGGDIYCLKEATPKDTGYVEITTGSTFGAARKANGTVIVWGNTGGTKLLPRQDYTKIAGGAHHLLALRRNGMIDCIGENGNGQCTIPAGTDFVDIGAGSYSGYAIRTNGSLTGWGTDHYQSAHGRFIAVSGRFLSPKDTGGVAIMQPPTNIVIFGNTSQITHWPSGMDYRNLTGSTAIRYNESREILAGAEKLSGNGWVQVASGAAITSGGDLVTWAPGLDQVYPRASGDCGKDPQKKYIAISQQSDWVLAIYENSSGTTCLEARGNITDHPEVLGHVPNATGWKKIAAGKNHALALRSDGTLVAWGNNDFGQLDLPVATNGVPFLFEYLDIAAGDDFSLGLTRVNRYYQNEGGYIVAAGKDDVHQVSAAPFDRNYYVRIAAGHTTSVALTRDGHVVIWGQPLAGVPAPQDGGYTDISLQQDYALLLKDSGP